MKKEMPFFMQFKKGAKGASKKGAAEPVKKMATGGTVRGKGCATKGFGFGRNG